ncbi:hypothetical protein VNO80_00749 [Phaseolus coccineus]|uniref:Uncharacterized protein n=1 Tax=Phaseolus coccineus TaxID=3886 RepID=A0AAN9RQX7_PHACN
MATWSEEKQGMGRSQCQTDGDTKAHSGRDAEARLFNSVTHSVLGGTEKEMVSPARVVEGAKSTWNAVFENPVGVETKRCLRRDN